MKLSKNFTKTSKDYPADETSKNAQLLIKAGFVNKTMAGVYSYLPLGLRVLNNIENIVRKNMNAIGGQEILMNSLHPKIWWDKTDRWDKEQVDVLFRLESQTGSMYALACSHEEQVTPLMQSFLNSYKELPELDLNNEIYPLAVYQIQTKFRDELRSKSGVMRGREFRMKDMYDFHLNQDSANRYYELVKETYFKIYEEMGLKAYAVHASGGMFTDNDSHEFQVLCDAGEDEILYSEDGYAINSEIFEELEKNGQDIPKSLKKAKSAEVGNIFKLGDKYSKAFDLQVTGKNNEKVTPVMNCHGIGTSRCLGVLAEIYSDEKGLKLPESVAPFKIHIITNYKESDDETLKSKIQTLANQIYSGEISEIEFEGQKISISKDQVLWDDRMGVSLGEKFKDADLIGCPYQVVITARSIESSSKGIEVKRR
jgi:prolyl-tRNA synthetase